MLPIPNAFLKWMLFSILFVCGQLFAQAAEQQCQGVAFVSSNSHNHLDIVHRIEATLASPLHPIQLTHITTENKAQPEIIARLHGHCLIVPVGSEALSLLLKAKITTPILSVASRKNVYQQLLQEYAPTLLAPISVIYIDQPLERQLSLIQHIFSTQKNKKIQIGALLGTESIQEHTLLLSLAKEKNLKLTAIPIGATENPVIQLDKLLDEANILFAIPDTSIYNPKTTRGILLTAFHKHAALIGYSRAYVTHGALAAVYSTSKQIAQQTSDAILTMIQNHYQPLASPQYPHAFTVAVNYQVARSLGIVIESEANLQLAMEDKPT